MNESPPLQHIWLRWHITYLAPIQRFPPIDWNTIRHTCSHLYITEVTEVFLVHCKSSNVKNVSFLNVNSVLCGKVKALCCSAPFCEDIYISGGEQMGANRLMHGDLAEHPPHFPKANFESLELLVFKGACLFYVLPSFLIIIVNSSGDLRKEQVWVWSNPAHPSNVFLFICSNCSQNC